MHDIRCDGINFATVDPSKGTVEAYNNVIYNVGTGPDFPEGEANYTCIYAADSGANGYGSGAIEVYNNTLYNCGSGNERYGAVVKAESNTNNMFMRLRNNIMKQDNNRSYLSGSATPGTHISGSNNIWHGNGVGPSATSANINADPKFVNLSGRDFHLQNTSPAIDAGISVSLTVDRDGVRRSGTIDIGAYEYNNGLASPPSSPCDLNGDGRTTSSDADIAIDQALDRVTCDSADINRNGSCNAVDVQRIINASLGSECKVSP
jgi:hypothetical protein